MSKPKVLLDTNILVSGLVFPKGNEHKILKMAEDEKIILVIPELVIEEATMVLARNFASYEILLGTFLSRIKYETVSWAEVQPSILTYQQFLRDRKDTPILVSIVVAKPDFVVTGDVTLRDDLKRCREVAESTRICSSRQFLKTTKTSC